MNTRSLFRAALAGALATGLLPATLTRTAGAQSAAQPFTSQIVVQNPNTSPASVVVNFYNELSGILQSAATQSFTLNPNGSTIILVGSLSLPSSWKGSAVISADQPVVAATIQVPPSGFGHIMANAFTADQASDNYFLTTFLRNTFNEVSVLAIQNTENQAISVRARFVPVSGSPVIDDYFTLPAFASKIYDAYVPSTLPSALGNPFNGSVVITATKGGGQPALIVATSETRRVDTNPLLSGRAYGFEAIPSSAGALTLYVPSALCKFGAGQQTTYFAIQNLSSSITASISISYAPGPGAPTVQSNPNVGPFQKWSVNPCLANGNASYNGSATIQSTQPIAAVIKVAQDNNGPHKRFVTAFLARGSGAQRLAVPYVRWSPESPGNDFRSFIAIQNVGNADIPAGQIVVRYYLPNGNLVKTCQSAIALQVGAKLNSNVARAYGAVSHFQAFDCASEPSNGQSYTFTGSAVIEGPSGSQLLAVVRTSPFALGDQIHTEDFDAIPLP